MDILYPLGFGSIWNDNELRYSLRSVEKNLKFDRVFIVGKPRKWLQNVEYIDFWDGVHKEINIWNKLVLASDFVSKDFLFMNDDHVILKPFNPDSLPYFYSGTIEDMIKKRNSGGQYIHSLKNTAKILEGKPQKYFDIHVPIVYNTDKIKELNEAVPWNLKFGYTIKSLYCNWFGIEGVELPDLKIGRKYTQAGKSKRMMTSNEYGELVEDRFCFSYGDQAVGEVFKKWIHSLYPEKSRFEI